MSLLFDDPVTDWSEWVIDLALTTSGAAVMFALIGFFVARRFQRFAYLSNSIFRTFGFDQPEQVNLLQRLRAARKSFSNEEHLKHHPHARWVYKY